MRQSRECRRAAARLLLCGTDEVATIVQQSVKSVHSVPRSPLFGRLLLGLTYRLRRLDALGVLKQIEREPFLSAEEIRANQFRRLSALLAHAEAHVPYYRALFRELRITTRDIRDWNDFARLPILTKDIVRDRVRDLVREDVRLERLSPHFSGGSTGVPLRFYRSGDYMAASDAGTFRNLIQCGWRPGEMVAFFWGGNEKLYRMSRMEFELRQFMRRATQFDPFRSGSAEMAEWARRIRSVRPRVVLGYASTIARFAEFLTARGEAVEHVKGVFTTAEKLYLPQRRAIECAFGAKVFDCYGSSEVQNIAAECSAGHMHVNADFVAVEEDRSEPNGPYPLILTSLRNWSMPFIRYRNEDCGRLSSAACSCGNYFPLMQLDIARTSDNFLLPDGHVVHGEFFTHLMYGSDGIETFQFQQTAIDRIRLWIVARPGDPAARQVKIQEAVRQIETLCVGQLRVEVREVEAIPLSAAGKHRFTRSDVDPSAVPPPLLAPLPGSES